VDAPFRFDKRVELVRDHVFQVREIGTEIFFVQEHFERLGRDEQKLRGLALLPAPAAFRHVAVPLGKRETGGAAERRDPFLLIVDERL
jgi:hypothetical protein